VNGDPAWVFEIAKGAGPAGVCLLAAYWYIRQLQTDISNVQQKRVDDAQSMINKLLELNDKWNEALNEKVDLAENTQELLKEVLRKMDR
jgi:hypothetical protein